MSVMHVLYELLPPDVRIFFFNDTATPDIYPLSLPDALPISIKPAYRVTLADGTELVASADHRFLTNRGWKRSEEHTSELQSQSNLVCRLLLEKKNIIQVTVTLLLTSLIHTPAGEDYHTPYSL